MYELIKVGERTYYIECPAKIGVYVEENGEVTLIDSGNDKEAGRKVRQILDGQGWKLKTILNTHSNADHIGGNKYLQGQTNCKIFAQGMERDFTRHTLLEPSFLYGGYPFKELRHKFLMAQESDVLEMKEAELPQGMEILPLYGHFFEMIGFRTPDDVVFLADCISSKETLDKYGIPFLYDVAEYLNTLDVVENTKATMFVPSHAEATVDVKELVRYNREKILEIGEFIEKCCEKNLTFEEVLKKCFDEYELAMTAQQYALVGSTVKSFLSWLKDSGRLTITFDENRMLWEKTYLIESERLKLRKLCQEDFKAVAEFLMDSEVMYAWEHGFSEDEVRQWIQKNIERYRTDGYSYFAAIERGSGVLVGVMGPLVEEVERELYTGIAYILNKKYWGRGFAEEGARACVNYAFDQLGAETVIAEIRPENYASRKVAEKVGMKEESSFVKLYNGKEMCHLIYSVKRGVPQKYKIVSNKK